MQRRWREKQHSSRWPLQWRGPRLQPRRRAAAPRQSDHSVTTKRHSRWVLLPLQRSGLSLQLVRDVQQAARNRAGRQTAGKLPSELRPRPKRRNGRSRRVLRHSAETPQVTNRSGQASLRAPFRPRASSTQGCKPPLRFAVGAAATPIKTIPAGLTAMTARSAATSQRQTKTKAGTS
jgi:hypothetical protein